MVSDETSLDIIFELGDKMRGNYMRYVTSFISGFILCMILVTVLMFGFNVVQASENEVEIFGFPIYFNNDEIQLEEAIIIDGRTYVQLREFCGLINVQVDWQDPKLHMLPAPGGNLPGGVNLTNPTYIYTDKVTNYYDTDEIVECVEITGIYSTFQGGYDYSFNDFGLQIIVDGKEELIPLQYNPSAGRMYITVSEFKEKLLPHMVEICMQDIE